MRETPLFPVLLASLAADGDAAALPGTRTHILEQVIEAVVRRRETPRETAREPTLPGVDPVPADRLDDLEVGLLEA